jgi:hypothetical protein
LKLKKEEFITQENYNLTWPFMPLTKTVHYDLGKILANHLFHLCSSLLVMKDSFDLARKIQQSSRADKLMVSFNVADLFIHIPLAFNIDYIFIKCTLPVSHRAPNVREQGNTATVKGESILKH